MRWTLAFTAFVRNAALRVRSRRSSTVSGSCLRVGPVLLLLLGCPPSADDDDSAVDPSCPEPWLSESCAETFCGEPTLTLGTGQLGWEPLPADGTMPIWYGGGMGDCMYHLRVAARTEELCPVVFIDWSVTIVGQVEPFFELQQHVMMVRGEGTVQDFFGMEAFLPMEWHPDDPEHAAECPPDSGQAGSLEDVQVLLEMEVWDHDDRAASAAATLQPVCCGPIE